ncbi:hypothetical protein M9H77_09017 [Catharanthus roseus]|uniref:Uncharacterized protein n=1 Tax=Catharanthus roseus TaxID=4058 RepID=A0ACC0BZC7_CATRO|nr:hypothetical protein M9H77_09017 [Catharanthus roseus]
MDQLISGLEFSSIEKQKQATLELRLLAKNTSENRIKIAKAGAIKPLISIISSNAAIKPLIRVFKLRNSTAKENTACALFRLSQIDVNKTAIGRAGAMLPLVNLLENGDYNYTL